MRWSVYGFVLAIQVIMTLPRLNATCQELDALRFFVYIIHHFLDVYVFWGFLFLQTPAEFFVHEIVILLVAVHWFTNNYECILTTYLNGLCGYPHKAWLDSIVSRLGSGYIHTWWILAHAVYDTIRFAY